MRRRRRRPRCNGTRRKEISMTLWRWVVPGPLGAVMYNVTKQLAVAPKSCNVYVFYVPCVRIKRVPTGEHTTECVCIYIYTRYIPIYYVRVLFYNAYGRGTQNRRYRLSSAVPWRGGPPARRDRVAVRLSPDPSDTSVWSPRIFRSSRRVCTRL